MSDFRIAPAAGVLTAFALFVVPPAASAQQAGGFAITVDGEAFVSDASVPRSTVDTGQADRRLDMEALQLQFDGLTVAPRLALGLRRGPDGGLHAHSDTNYPAFIRAGEVLVVEPGPVGPRVLERRRLAPNGTVALPAGLPDTAYLVHRVYDARGRFDQTRAVPLSEARPGSFAPGTAPDMTRRRGIPVAGGAVTVSGTELPPGASVATLGTEMRPDPSGAFAVQRILPPGPHDVAIRVRGAGPRAEIVRRVEVPRHEFFHVGTVDLTWGRRFPDAAAAESYTEGRVAFYLDGVTASRTRVTARADTGERPLDDLFGDLDALDPRETVLRVDPDDLYPTYGDDSLLENHAPSRGKVYLKVERDNNFAVWGNSRLGIDGNAFLRGDRVIYGGQAHVETPAVTASGEPRASLDLYAAQDDQVTRSDVLRGTGGSVYFLSRQDLIAGSETLSVELRDASTGRVLGRETLAPGEDYDINYFQGVVTLRRPLTGSVGTDSILRTRPSGDTVVNLVARYDHTPLAGDLDDYAFGGRAEAWVTDNLRLGLTGTSEQTARDDDQTATAGDLLYRLGDGSYARLDHAVTDGPGFEQAVSLDGGLGFSDRAQADGAGRATSAEVVLDFADIGLGEGAFDLYAERRSEGFVTLDHAVTEATGDEEIFGGSLRARATERLSVALDFDSYANEAGQREREAGIEARYALAPGVEIGAGLAHVERRDDGESGARTDLGARIEFTPSDALSYYGFAQATLSRSGDVAENDRIGAGVEMSFRNGWAVQAEVSDGDLGTAADLRLSRDDGEAGSTYIGLELDPGTIRTADRAFGVGTEERNGRLVAGKSRRVTGDLRVFGENSHDILGERRATTSTYGVDYALTDDLNASAAMEVGRIEDTDAAAIDRTAVTLGLRYAGEALTAAGRIEYRQDSSTDPEKAGEVAVFTGDLRYEIDDSQRLVASLDAVQSSGGITALSEGDYVDATVGYALRPVDGNRFNMLLQHRYVRDDFGQRSGEEDDFGPVQRSRIVSVDANYDVSEALTLGGKVGFRMAETAPEAGGDFEPNDARLLVVNGRYAVTRKWDTLLELRDLDLVQAGVRETGVLAAVYRSFGDNAKLGVGYNAGRFSDDLADLTFDDRGVFVNLVAKF